MAAAEGVVVGSNPRCTWDFLRSHVPAVAADAVASSR